MTSLSFFFFFCFPALSRVQSNPRKGRGGMFSRPVSVPVRASPCSFSVQRSCIHTRTAPLGIFIFPHPGEWVGGNFIFSNMSRRPHSNSSPPTAIGRAGREALPPRRGRRRHLRPHRHWFERQALGRAGTETWKSVLVSGSHKRAGSVRFYMRVFS